jgi:NAD(P)-dependent dehydrogenase (short-subunit alcohol dehydrogenase family)
MPNSVAIVAGASQGIGKATALRLSRDFSSLVLIARDFPSTRTARRFLSVGNPRKIFHDHAAVKALKKLWGMDAHRTRPQQILT